MITPSHTSGQPRANKTDAGNGSYGICRVIDASRSPSPDPKRSPNFNTSFAMFFRFVATVTCFIALASCSTVESNVTRFHTLPPKGTGQSFVIRSESGQSSIEFSQYSQQISKHLQAYGWTPASSNSADYIVVLAYQMGGSRERSGSLPLYGQTGGGTTYHSGSFNSYGSGGYSSGTFGGTSYTPATFGVVGAAPYSYTVHDRYMVMTIRDRAGTNVFEGKVNSSGSSAEIAAVLPEMIDSLFTGFPGVSGKTKKISKVNQ
jgi:hypothetical protein